MTNYYMFTPEGNAAVSDMLAQIKATYASDPKVRNRRTLRNFVLPIFSEVAARPECAEITDTEPRSKIADALDAICSREGWAFDEWASWGLV